MVTATDGRRRRTGAATTVVTMTCERRSGEFHVAEILPSGGSHSAKTWARHDGRGGTDDGWRRRARRVRRTAWWCGSGDGVGGAAGCVHSPWARSTLMSGRALADLLSVSAIYVGTRTEHF
jgi:hypothetical protein